MNKWLIYFSGFVTALWFSYCFNMTLTNFEWLETQKEIFPDELTLINIFVCASITMNVMVEE
jgi:hypothetical protein